MGRKSKKEFNKLSSEKKAEVLQAALIEKTSKVLAQEIPKAMINGMKLEREDVYRKYVQPIDECKPEERDIKIEKLLSYFRIAHLQAEKEKMEAKSEI